MDNCRDFLDYLGPDPPFSILRRLDDPADLARASSVSRHWRQYIIANSFCKNLCLRMCPEVSKFTRALEVNSSHMAAEVGSSSDVEWEILKREHRIFAYLSQCLVSSRGKRDCIFEGISASSTDNYPDESIENTLEPDDRIFALPSYWSSRGESDSEVPETLTYRLWSKLCVISEIKIQPFEAFFQHGLPIYSAKAVRFRMGHSRLTEGNGKDAEHATGPVICDYNYVWTYVSPVFPMAQENVVQSFKLPRSVVCIGGIVQVELLGRVQKQEMDGLYYLCICHVGVIGRPLSPVLDVDILDSSGNSVLKYFPDAPCSISPEGLSDDNATIDDHSLVGEDGHPPAGGGWIFNALLGIAADDSGSDEEAQYT